ncbi:MAG TPA: hypothetical protein VK453_20190 [Micromonosporaceae bacterium]|nr:hypothetical protein [Micromonosporaceae bacterium]
MEDDLLSDVLSRWCEPAFAAAVRAAGIDRVEASNADVGAMRTIYIRRRLRAGAGSPMLVQIDGVLQVLDSVEGNEIGMVHFVARDGREGIVLTDQLGAPLFAFPVSEGGQWSGDYGPAVTSDTPNGGAEAVARSEGTGTMSG